MLPSPGPEIRTGTHAAMVDGWGVAYIVAPWVLSRPNNSWALRQAGWRKAPVDGDRGFWP